jgi:hypothetical protein
MMGQTRFSIQLSAKLSCGLSIALLALSLAFGPSAARAEPDSPAPSWRERLLNPIMTAMHTVEARLSSLEASIALSAGFFTSQHIATQKLCVYDNTGETCITKAQLDAVLTSMARAVAAGPTNAPPAVTEAPATVIEPSVTPTEAQAVVTEAPAAVTEAPAAVTDAPATVIEPSATVTEAPAVVTEAPGAVTEGKATVIEPSVTATEAPAMVTEAPAAVTEAPATVIEPSATITEAPAIVTEAPGAVTEGKAQDRF